MLRKYLAALLIPTIAIFFSACAKTAPAVTAIEASELHNYAIDEEGTLWFWGTTLGRGTPVDDHPKVEDCLSPEPQKLMEDVQDVSAGEAFTLILKNDGTLWGWGTYADTQERLDPAKKLMDNVVQISAEGSSLYALDENGILWDWGTASRIPHPEAGNNVYELSRPTQVMENVREISASDFGVLCVREDDSLWSLSHSNNAEKRMDNVSSVFAGTYLSAAIDANGTLWVWGEAADITELAQDVLMAAVERMGTEAHHDTLLFVTQDHTLWLQGYDIRTGQYENIPIPLMDGVKSVSLSSSHVLVLTTAGEIMAWGDNSAAALASNSVEYAAEPVSIVLN